MDGETCLIIEENKNIFVLANSDGEQVTTFTLTNDEMKVGSFSFLLKTVFQWIINNNWRV